MRARSLIAVVLLLSLPALAACGSDTSSSVTPAEPSTDATEAAPAAASGGSGATVLELAADPNGALEFDKTELEAPAGTVTLEMRNDSAVDHNIAIEGDGVDVVGEITKDGGTSAVTADLEPGTYTYYCSVDGHEEAGMKGTLTVS